MGVYYQPPQPPTASGTPPEPHVPIGTQGSAPPRRTIAVLMLAVLASWPADLEPRLGKPNERQQQIAPLTLTYGQQPARIGTSPQTRYETAVGSWPLDLEPRLDLPNNRRQTIAPLTLRYGDTPPIVGGSAITEALIVSTWPDTLEPRLGPPNQRRQTIAPLTLVYGNPPPLIGTSGSTRAQIVGSAWPLDLEPRLGGPNDRRVVIATLTLPRGDQPSPHPALTIPDWLAITAPVADWPAQGSPRSIAWIGFTPPVVPPDQPAVAFPYGLILATWPVTWPAQTAPPNAGWNVPPILIELPHVPLPGLIWQAWEPPLMALPHAGVIASLLATAVTPSTRGPAIILVDGRLAIRLDDFNYAWIT